MAPKYVKIWENEDLKAEYRKWHQEKFGNDRGNKTRAAEYFQVSRGFIGRIMEAGDICIPNEDMRNEMKFKKGPRGWVPFDEEDE